MSLVVHGSSLFCRAEAVAILFTLVMGIPDEVIKTNVVDEWSKKIQKSFFYKEFIS